MKKMIFAFGLLSFALFALVFDLANVRSNVWAVTFGWAINGDNVYFTDGNVGIGTDTPTNDFEIQTRLDYTNSPQLYSYVYNGDGEFSYLHDIRTFAMDSNNLYVTGGSARGVTIIDMSDPSDPALLSEIYDGDGEFNRLFNPDHIKIYGNYAYIVSESESGITIADISDPTDPDLQSEFYHGDGEFSTFETPQAIALHGNTLFVLDANNGITAIDVSNKTNPSFIAHIPDSGAWANLSAGKDLEIQGDYLYIATSNAIMIVNVSTGMNLQSEIYDGDGEFNYLDNPLDIFVEGNFMYVTSYNEDAVTIIDISDPTDPELVAEIYDGDGEFDQLDDPRQVHVTGNIMVVASKNDDSLTIADISNPASPQQLKTFKNFVSGINKLDAALATWSNEDFVFVGSQGGAYGQAIYSFRIYEDYPVFTTDDNANVGIGTLTPAATLDVEGFMRLEVNSSAPTTCDATTDGSIALTSNYYGCTCKNGTGWVKLSDGSTSCSW